METATAPEAELPVDSAIEAAKNYVAEFRRERFEQAEGPSSSRLKRLHVSDEAEKLWEKKFKPRQTQNDVAGDNNFFNTLQDQGNDAQMTDATAGPSMPHFSLRSILDSLDSFNPRPQHKAPPAASTNDGKLTEDGRDPVDADMNDVEEEAEPEEDFIELDDRWKGMIRNKDKFLYPAFPERQSLKSVIELEGLSGYFGTLFDDGEALLDHNLGLNYGHDGRPAVTLRMRISKHQGQPLKSSDSNTYYSFVFKFQPGLKIPGTTKYEVEEVAMKQATPMFVVDPEMEDKYGFQQWQDDMDSKSLKALSAQIPDPEQNITGHAFWDKLLFFQAELGHGRYEGPGQVMKANIRDLMVKQGFGNLWEKLTKSASFKVTAWGIIPTKKQVDSPKQASSLPDSSVNTAKWVHEHWSKFNAMLTTRHKPLGQYCKNYGSGEYESEQPLDSIQFFGNRMYCKFSWEDQKNMEQQMRVHGTIVEWPLARSFRQFGRNLYPSTVEEFLITHDIGQRRIDEFRKAQSIHLSKRPHHALVKRFEKLWHKESEVAMTQEQADMDYINKRPKAVQEPAAVNLSRDEAVQSSSFYAYIYLSKDEEGKKEGSFVESSSYLVDFIRRDSKGKIIHAEEKLQAFGHAVNLDPEEKKLTQADGKLVIRRAKGGPKIPALHSLDAKVPIPSLPEVIVTEKFNDDDMQRTRDGLWEFCDLERKDLEALRQTIIFDAPRSVDSKDITLTQTPNSQDYYREAVKELKETFMTRSGGMYDMQFKVLDSLVDVKDRIKLTLGAAGTQKSSVFAWMALLLGAIGHKIHVCARENVVTNEFIKKCHALQQQAIKKNLQLATEAFRRQRFLRFVPFPREMSLLKRGSDLKSGDVYKNQSRTAENTLKDSRVLDMLKNYAEEHKQLLAQADEALRKKLEVKSKSIKCKLEAVQKDYDALTKHQSFLEYPVECSLAYQIQEKIKQDVKANTAAQKYASCLKVFLDDNIKNDVAVTQEFELAIQGIFAEIINSATVVAATYSASYNNVLGTYWTPTIAVHEQANRTRIAEACILLGMKGIQCHVVSGDEQQLPPHKHGAIFNEMTFTSDVSLLSVLVEKGVESDFLGQQSRGHPDIYSWPGDYFYKKQLTHAPCTQDPQPYRPKMQAVMKKIYGPQTKVNFNSHYFVIDSQYGVAVREEDGTSLQNFANAKIAFKLYQEAMLQGIPPHEFAYISPYRAQLKRYTALMKEHDIDPAMTHISSVDAYQGSECSVVVSDFVGTAHKMDFLEYAEERIQSSSGMTRFAIDEKRICVMFTRAKDCHITICNAQTMGAALARQHEKSMHRVTKSLLADGHTRNVICTDTTPDDNPVLLHAKASAKAEEEWAQLKEMQANTEWMRDAMEQKLEHKPRVREPKPAWTGENFMTPWDCFPDAVAEKERQGKLNAKKGKSDFGEAGLKAEAEKERANRYRKAAVAGPPGARGRGGGRGGLQREQRNLGHIEDGEGSGTRQNRRNRY